MSKNRNTPGGSQRRKRIKRALARRDGACCWYCAGDFGPELEGATVDHLIPHTLLRTWMLAALVLACEPCNRAKADRLPQEVLRPRFAPGLVPVGADAAA
ncbi:HNH endonuclease [Streptomyces antarcticus]|uniref:HNH endonuclease n=1 Tax=Streptomyces antarcticus TaxID=2996458 RepID=UPI00226FC0DC|nr:HNH endonuclease signature motif containing protein [Streptomyces sp. H34-AA3]MCY0947859.1 HNH endonuclease signature motif containing protein [Streptomyces sp. H34-AA3]